MAPKDLLLALVVILAWGVNFVVINVGLHGVPPMLLGGLRFLLASVPAVFFVRRPQIPWRLLALYGSTILLGQFVFLFSAMYVGMPAGLASLVLQAQAFFTLFFAMLVLGERLRAQNLAGLAIAAIGLVAIAVQGGRGMTLAGFLLTIGAAALWALGNVVTKRIGKVDLVSLVVWASLVPPVPFFVLSYWFEGPQRIEAALTSLSGASIFAVVYLAFVATLLGYGLWSRLLSRYPAGQVAPFSLLVPVVGLASSALLLGEQLTHAQLAGAALVMAGLAVNVFGDRVVRRFFAAAS
ncbi:MULTISPECIES: EamA family transporter [Burkholderia]|uniref:EamA family transporter n=1 Tax=Burkholderia TaxID=32008 RepID=UPI0007580545|nr:MULTISPECIES: EamA family transporter [Burkholderia]AOJ70911.1 acetylserine transporter [Burkholderia savannae]KVG41778.1 acetylserine transporter [Burkholderia sp. MSMB0265]KVG88634.1 acetylserine transporter [Burkholderia sp. MSMB2040]KVG94848.1 acetylserine transporter [Burkholderia sp. MSMB2042]KVG98432.1 acetylserine transporter [Burkholderia sp. MSMB2041]